jgi:hypothetical protein
VEEKRRNKEEKREDVSKRKKSGSSEVQELCHCYTDTLLSDTAFD